MTDQSQWGATPPPWQAPQPGQPPGEQAPQHGDERPTSESAAPAAPVPPGHNPAGANPPGQPSPAQAHPGHALPGQIAPGQGPPGHVPPGQAPFGQGPYGQPSYGQPFYGQQSYGQAPYGQLPPPPPSTTVRVTRGADPLAVAVGNASLLGVGYLLLRRRWLALLTGLVTVLLLVLLVFVTKSVWLEYGLLAWWVVLIGHGLRLAGRSRPAGAARQRVVALAVALPVLLAVTLLRVDAAGIESDVAAARAAGSCPQATSALDGVWFGHRVADAPLTARTDQTTEACARLSTASRELESSLPGDVKALSAGYRDLAAVHRDLPGHGQLVRTTLDGYLNSLRGNGSCANATLTDWLRQHGNSARELDASAAVAGTAPAALVDCGDQLLDAGQAQQAKDRYRQFLGQYPQDGHAAQARTGLRKATLSLQLTDVRNRLEGPPGDDEPTYCGSPAKYEAAPAYRRGVNRSLIYGSNWVSGKLPGNWHAPDATKTSLVVCIGDARDGAVVQTCPYVSQTGLNKFPVDVKFHKIALPVRAYELRTGRLVVNRTVQIGGASCPSRIHYDTYGADIGPPSDTRVTASTSDVREALRPVIQH